VRDENRKNWWNLGGWGNQRHAIEMGGLVGQDVPGSIDTGRWYDIRIETSGKTIKCYLDGKLIHDVTPPVLKSLYASASRDKGTGEVILKVVNTSRSELSADVKLNGVKTVQGPAKATVLTSENPTDENSLTEPTKVAPVTKTIDMKGPSFQHAFPAYRYTRTLGQGNHTWKSFLVYSREARDKWVSQVASAFLDSSRPSGRVSYPSFVREGVDPLSPGSNL
jgi:alpha-L-arabinofuranosidase